jgi:hypothetical protein
MICYSMAETTKKTKSISMAGMASNVQQCITTTARASTTCLQLATSKACSHSPGIELVCGLKKKQGCAGVHRPPSEGEAAVRNSAHAGFQIFCFQPHNNELHKKSKLPRGGCRGGRRAQIQCHLWFVHAIGGDFCCRS